MWADPIEMAAIRGENKREAERLGITLEEHLHNQYLKQSGKNIGHLNEQNTNIVIRFFKWVLRLD
jgi:hypothetical protein